MGHGLHDLARHNAWATGQVLAYCRGLDEPTLHATVPGTYGTILETLRHIIASEASYLARASGATPPHPWRTSDPVGIDELAERAAELSGAWERYLAGEVDLERLGEARGDEGERFAVPSGVFITQALHHANEHRAQICTILGALGRDTPEVSGWDWAIDTGRMTPTTTDG